MNDQLYRLRQEQIWVNRLIQNTHSKLARESLYRRLEELNEAVSIALAKRAP